MATIQDYLTWIDNKIFDTLGVNAYKYPTYAFDMDPNIVLFCKGITSEIYTNKNVKSQYKFTIEIGYAIEQGAKLETREASMVAQMESLYNTFKKIENRTTGVNSGDLVKTVDLDLTVERRGGIITRLGKLDIIIEVVN